MYQNGQNIVGKTENGFISLLPQMANRHGLIAGATGTGKTVTLKVLAEAFSDMGVPVFLADVKGDLSGFCEAGKPNEKLTARLGEMGFSDFPFHAYPVRFWDVYGERGIPVRTTISDLGAPLLSRLLHLTNVQEGVLNIAFRYADDHYSDEKPLYLFDIKDLRSMLRYLGDNGKTLTTQYGNVTRQSVGAILRSVLALDDVGGEKFFGEPMLDIRDWQRTTAEGKGFINILDCVQLFQNPLLYSTFLLWMMGELFENLPEVGDLDKPRMVFFFDEAHVLFDEAPKALVKKVEQMVKLIRSKGVGIYFVTQNPADIPNDVLTQLGNRIQHALRSYTPADQKAVRAAAKSYRPNPAFSTEQVITELGTGEAIVSFLQADGSPAVVERVRILPPCSAFGAASDEICQTILQNDELLPKYQNTIDSPSAYETLEALQQEVVETPTPKPAPKSKKKPEKTIVGKVTESTLLTLGRELSRIILRGIFGSRKRGSLVGKLETTLINTTLSKVLKK